MYGIPPDELAMQQREAVETEMLSIEQIDHARGILNKVWPGFQSDSPVDRLCAMARRSAISEAAGKDETPETDTLLENISAGKQKLSGQGLTAFVSFTAPDLLEAHAKKLERSRNTLRTHATALQSKLAEVEAENARLKAETFELREELDGIS